MNIVNRLRYVANAHAEKPAIVTVEETLSYGELYDRADRYAAALTDLDVGENDRFCLLMENSTRMLAVVLAGWQLGATPAPINTRLGSETIRFLVADTGATTRPFRR